MNARKTCTIAIQNVTDLFQRIYYRYNAIFYYFHVVKGRLYIQSYRKLDYKFGFSHLWKKDGLNGSHLPTSQSNTG